MSGPFGSSQWMYSSGADFYSHKINQSLRFEDGDSAYLSRTPSSAGNRKTWTWSGWVKRGNLGGAVDMFSAGDGTTANRVALEFENNVLRFVIGDGTNLLDTNALFRDASSWYHVLVAVDTTQATASDRVNLYVNGTKMTSFSTSTYPTQNLDTFVNNTNLHTVGARYRTSVDSHFDGYMAEVNFVDGSALTPASFGETKAGIWIPKDTSGLTFGTNGFRLKFQDSSALGDDTSGNGNDFSSSGLAATDVLIDSPSNNFCTYNDLDANSPSNYTYIKEGNLLVGDAVSTDAAKTVGGTIAMRSGKWYFEICRTLARNDCRLGIIREDKFVGQNSTGNTGLSAGDYSYHVDSSGNLSVNGSSTSSWQGSLSDDDVFQVAYDADTGKVWFGINNTWGGSGDPANGTNQAATVDSYSDYGYKIWTRVVGNSSGYEEVTLNCGQDSSFAGVLTAGGNADGNGIGDFKYAPPSGFLALCASNLPNPAIDPAQDEEPADHFNTVLYSGTGSTQRITGVGFQPDWIWFKARNAASGHVVYDSVRGATIYLQTASSSAEGTGADSQTSFDSDGFSVGADTSTTGVNKSSTTYVAWNWLAGGTAVTNNDGSVTSSVSANTKAGFSIVTHDNGSGTRTVGHGLDKAPELIIEKKRDSSGDWLTQTTVIDGSNDYLRLNTTDAKADGVGASPTSTVYTPNVGGGADCLAYCFHSVDGYSKVGNYTGNNSSDGPFVYTGFRPALVIVKNITGSEAWGIGDSVRDPSNVLLNRLYPNLSNAEYSTGDWLDLVSNGFKSRGGAFNTSSATYIYLAFAEQPFKYSNAR